MNRDAGSWPGNDLAPSSETQRRSAEWDLHSGPRNYLALIAAQAASTAAALAGTWVATRALGAAGYGGIVAILAASQLVSQLAVNWTVTSLSRYGCEEFVKTGRIANTFWGRLVILIPNLLLLMVASPLWLPLVSAWLHIPRAAHPLVLIYLVVTCFWTHVQLSLQGAKLVRLQGILLAGERTLMLGILVMLTLFGSASLFSVALAYILSAFVMGAVGLWRLRFLIYPGVRLDRPLLRQMLVFSFPLIPASLIGYLSTNYLDALFISRFLSTADLGVYSVAYQLAGTTMQLPLLAGSLLMPLFITFQVSEQREHLSRFMREILPLLALLWSTGCAILAALGTYLLPLIFGPEFVGTVALLWPLLVASAFAGPVLIGYWPLSNTMGMTYVPAVNSVIAACVNVGLNLLLIPRFGLIGCAWATAGAYGAGVLATTLLVHWRVPLSRSWTVQACLPILFGAAYVAWRADNLGALVITVVLSVLLAFLHRRHISAGLTALIKHKNFGSSAQPAAVR
ncbi:MAG: oligosaccharide flippase family protein [bacterium]